MTVHLEDPMIYGNGQTHKAQFFVSKKIEAISLNSYERKNYRKRWACTNEILILDVNSAKNSLAIIYMCLKMHCLKYVIYFILFLFYSIFLYSCGPGVAI